MRYDGRICKSAESKSDEQVINLRIPYRDKDLSSDLLSKKEKLGLNVVTCVIGCAIDEW